jgi:hypothetical protein
MKKTNTFLVILYCLIILWASFFCYHFFKLDITEWYGFPYIITSIIVFSFLPLKLIDKEIDKANKELDEKRRTLK